jgi:hypothetical protein
LNREFRPVLLKLLNDRCPLFVSSGPCTLRTGDQSAYLCPSLDQFFPLLVILAQVLLRSELFLDRIPIPSTYNPNVLSDAPFKLLLLHIRFCRDLLIVVELRGRATRFGIAVSTGRHCERCDPWIYAAEGFVGLGVGDDRGRRTEEEW